MAVDENDWKVVACLYRKAPDIVRPAFGVHPWYVQRNTVGWEDRLQDMLKQHPAAIVGEIGLDKAVLKRKQTKPAADVAAGMGTPRCVDCGCPGCGLYIGISQEVSKFPDFKTQVCAFAVQLRIAGALKRPTSVHCVRAFGDLFDLFSTKRKRGEDRDACSSLPPTCALHSYSGSRDFVKSLLSLEAKSGPSFTAFYFGFSALVNLHRQSTARLDKLRGVLTAIPRTRVLLESDAPTPVCLGERLTEMLTFLQSLWGTSHAETALQLNSNASRFYGGCG
jgi:TatD DNase family protein